MIATKSSGLGGGGEETGFIALRRIFDKRGFEGKSGFVFRITLDNGMDDWIDDPVQTLNPSPPLALHQVFESGIQWSSSLETFNEAVPLQGIVSLNAMFSRLLPSSATATVPLLKGYGVVLLEVTQE